MKRAERAAPTSDFDEVCDRIGQLMLNVIEIQRMNSELFNRKDERMQEEK